MSINVDRATAACPLHSYSQTEIGFILQKKTPNKTKTKKIRNSIVCMICFASYPILPSQTTPN
jgi:hypothetical protein